MCFEQRTVQKTYVALVAGHLVAADDNDKGTVDFPIGKVPTPEGYNVWSCHDTDDDDTTGRFLEGSLRNARTDWTVSARLSVPLATTGLFPANYTRVELAPRTGRGHQLRLHTLALGHPILGDTLHAPHAVARVTQRLCLHAETLQIDAMICAATDNDDVQDETDGNGFQRVSVTCTSVAPF